MGYGERCPLLSQLVGLGEHRELLAGFARNAFWRILKATEHSFLHLYTYTLSLSNSILCHIWGRGKAKVWGAIAPWPDVELPLPGTEWQTHLKTLNRLLGDLRPGPVRWLKKHVITSKTYFSLILGKPEYTQIPCTSCLPLCAATFLSNPGIFNRTAIS